MARGMTIPAEPPQAASTRKSENPARLVAMAPPAEASV